MNVEAIIEEHKSISIEREKAILVGLILVNESEWIVQDHLDELEALADTAGADVVKRITQRKMRIDAATFVGGGKVNEIATECKRHDIDLVIFDDDLTPVQVRNLEKKIQVKVVDRSGLILDIFARRAKTREAKVQVELAQLEYYYPRLIRQWTHLKGSQGGIGFRGPGETQLEVDRRAVQKRISFLKKELDKISRQRSTRRAGRKDEATVALIGYTNVGKSTILNTLSGKQDAFVENRLFATLDPKVRRFEAKPGKPILVIDTVGFIRKLPHHLVASFRSTLEEAEHSDLLVHVVDLSHPRFEDQIKQTRKVMESLGLSKKPELLVFNKIDLLSNSSILERAKENYEDALFISAEKGHRVWELQEKMEELLFQPNDSMELLVSPEQLKNLEENTKNISILNKKWEEGLIRLKLVGKQNDLNNVISGLGL
ncbi:GTPase HflX [bacterium]|nr:GTPase HflX [bacterium]